MGESPCFPIGKKTPLNPPLSGGQKALPLRGRLASLSGMNPPLDPPLSGGQKLSPFGRVRPEGGGVCCRCPPDKGDPPEGGRGFCCCPPDKGDTPEGGRGFCFSEPPCFPSGRKPPLIPPYQGGKKLSPFGVALERTGQSGHFIMG